MEGFAMHLSLDAEALRDVVAALPVLLLALVRTRKK